MICALLPDIQPNRIQLVSGKIAIFQTDFCRLLNMLQDLLLADQCVRIKLIKQFADILCSQLRYRTITRHLYSVW
jgi:hypothetical protein